MSDKSPLSPSLALSSEPTPTPPRIVQQQQEDDEEGLDLPREGEEARRPNIEFTVPLDDEERRRRRLSSITTISTPREDEEEEEEEVVGRTKRKTKKAKAKGKRRGRTAVVETKTMRLIFPVDDEDGDAEGGKEEDASPVGGLGADIRAGLEKAKRAVAVARRKGGSSKWKRLRGLLSPGTRAGSSAGSGQTGTTTDEDEDDEEDEEEDAEEKRKRKKRKKKKRRRRKRKNAARETRGQLNIEVEGVSFPIGGSREGEEGLALEPPPEDLSPRSRAAFARMALRKAAADRKRRKRKKKREMKEKKRRKRKRKRRRRKKKSKGDPETDSEEEEDGGGRRRPGPSAGGDDDHFYPTPRGLRRRRRAFVAVHKPVVCSICQGVHYRTKRNFASNIRIIMNVNRALGGVLSEMRGRMGKIDGNLERVKRNLQFLEDMYEGVFRKVNRLIA